MQYDESARLGGMVVIVDPGDKPEVVISFAKHIGAFTLGGGDDYYFNLRLPGDEDKLYLRQEVVGAWLRGWR